MSTTSIRGKQDSEVPRKAKKFGAPKSTVKSNNETRLLSPTENLSSQATRRDRPKTRKWRTASQDSRLEDCRSSSQKEIIFHATDIHSTSAPAPTLLSCFYTNAQSIVNKLHEFESFIEAHQPRIIGITETWCPTDLPDGCFSLQGYHAPFRKDRTIGRGGGVLLLVHESLDVTSCDELTNSEFDDSVWCQIKLIDDDLLLVGTVYRSTSSCDNNNKHLLELIDAAMTHHHTHLVIMGDFNYPEVDFVNSISHLPDNAHGTLFLEKIYEHLLKQHINVPTRYREGSNPSTLDLVFTNEEFMIDNITTKPPLGKSDHIVLLFDILLYTTQRKYTNHRNIHKADYNALQSTFSNFNWATLLKDTTAEESWNIFLNVYTDAVNAHAPMYTDKPPKRNTKWQTAKVKRAIKKRCKLWNTFELSQLPHDYELYRNQRNYTSNLVKKAHERFEKNLVQSFKNCPKKFYSYVRNKQNTRIGITQLKKEDGSVTIDDRDTAQTLCDFFSSVFIKDEDDNLPAFLPDIHHQESLDDIDFSITDVEAKLKTLKENSSPGPDNVHPKVLKLCYKELAPPIWIIMKTSLSEGRVPTLWKISNVTPIHKKGSRNEAANYRPISLTCVICKVMESLLKDHIMYHLDQQLCLSKHQHGFVSKRSCLTNLLETFESWTSSLDDKEVIGIDAVFLDYQKAFDRVPHKRLLLKINAYGISGKVLAWIKSFLTERHMTVSIRGRLSQQTQIQSGVPQGSVLGPVLFLLYINDIVHIVDCNIKLFADDTKIWTQIKDGQDREKLQGNLNKLGDWSNKWLLKFNIGKCKRMHLGTKNDGNQYYMLNAEERSTLTKITEERDLGVWTTDTMKVEKQCHAAANQATSALRLLKLSFQHLDKTTFLLLYKTYVRVHLEYCVQAWSPHYSKDIKHLERIQRRATKLVHGLRNKPYNERLTALNLYSLEQRRLRGDLIETYKILTKKENIEPSQFFGDYKVTQTRGHTKKLYKEQSRLDIRKHFFSQRVVNYWNLLPDNVVTAPSTNIFKNRLDRYWHDMSFKIGPTA